jgi:hypothetical protein
MTPEEPENFKPANGAEILAWEQFNNARSGKPSDTLNASKEVTDRTEGRARQLVQVDNTAITSGRALAGYGPCFYN